MIKILFVSILLMSCSSCARVMDYLNSNPDNAVEEMTENFLETAIEQNTGYRPKIDLTPESPELY